MAVEASEAAVGDVVTVVVAEEDMVAPEGEEDVGSRPPNLLRFRGFSRLGKLMARGGCEEGAWRAERGMKAGAYGVLVLGWLGLTIHDALGS